MVDLGFENLAQSFLEKLVEEIEEKDIKHSLTVDFIDGVLNVELEDGRLYIINRHLPSTQIWLSSPVSGADYFSYKENKWLNKNNLALTSILFSELQQICEFKT